LVALLALLHPNREWPKQALNAIEQNADSKDARTRRYRNAAFDAGAHSIFGKQPHTK
jgi:hypothetical protein